MKDKLTRVSMAAGLLMLCVMQFTIFADASSLSNELLRWGFRRGENELQPTLDSKAKQVIESFDGITIGNSHEKTIYLTFDNGYEAGYTEKILNILKIIDDGYSLSTETGLRNLCIIHLFIDEKKKTIHLQI